MYIELLNHVSSEFPAEYYYVDTSRSTTFQFPAQWHPNVEMLRVLDGVFHVTLNNVKYTLRKGDILFINPETIHFGTPENCIYDCVVFKPSLLFSETLDCRFFFENLTNMEYTVTEFFPASAGYINSAAGEIFDAMSHKTPGYKFRVIGAFYKFFGAVVDEHLYSSGHNESFDNQDIVKLKKALAFMQKNYSNSITLKEIAETTGMSLKYFCSFFRKMTGRTPFTYLTDYRVDMAVQRLVGSDMSITEVALSCGFNDLSYFIKIFKNIKGVSPGQFRKENK